MYYIRTMRTRKLQSKVEPELEDHVKKQPDYQGMSDYIRIAIKQKSKFKPKKGESSVETLTDISKGLK